MAKMKIYEIARSLQSKDKELKSGDLVKMLNDNGFDVKGPNSNVEDAEIAFLLKSFSNEKKAPVKEKKVEPVKTAPVKTEQPKPAPKTEEKKEVKKEVQRESNNRNNQNQGRPQNNNSRPQNQGGYNRNNNNNNRDGQNRPQGQGGYNRNNQGQGQGNRPQGQGGYNRNNQGQGQGNRPQGQGGYNRNNQGQGQGNRPQGQGGYNRGAQGQGQGQSQGGNRSGGYNRGGQGQGGYNRGTQGQGQGGYNRGGQGQSQGGNRSGGYNNNRGGNRPQGQNGQQGGVYERFEKSQSSFDGIKQETKTSRQRNKKQPQKDTRDTKGRYRKSSLSEMERIRSKKDPNRKGAFIKPEPVKKEPEEQIKQISIPENLTIKDLADKMKMPASVLIKKLFLQGKMVSLNQDITFEEAEEIALEFDILAEVEEKVDVVAELLKEEDEDETDMTKRPPVVCVMGHVDHGKTSLLDAIRKANVTSGEAGGITQHIGAYMVRVKNEKITFLDTPGHEAFTSMRMRGAQSTDIAILVVAADDGVMPQTIEAINHAKAAGVEIIVAVNKIDKPGANVERVKQELAEYELISEDWGGSTVFVPVSAHTKEGIDQLLEMILLTAEVLELKANKKRMARGIVIEAQLDKGRGPVATVLVQKGTLRVGDHLAAGSANGKVRAMLDHNGERVKKAGPSTPVEILGLSGVPDAGEVVVATETDKEAKTIANAYVEQGKEKLLEETRSKKLSLDGLFSQIQAGNIKELNIIIKADVQGSVQAVKQSLVKLSNDEVAVRVIHGGVGAINESDVSLAIASNAIIIGFNVRPDNVAKETADREEVDVRLYKVIYDAIADVESAMKGMLEPIYEEKVIAHAEVRQTFKASVIGTIAGCYVLDGKIERGCKARITRGEELVFEGDVASLKRFKDDVKEVSAGYECGLVFEKFNEVFEEDQVECYMMVEVPR